MSTVQPAMTKRLAQNRLIRSIDTRARRVPGGWPSVVAMAIPVLAMIILGWTLRWMSDDGWINIRVLSQFFDGNGPVFNKGERVEVGTSTIWLGILMAAHVVAPGVEISVLAMPLGVLFTGLGVLWMTLGSARLMTTGEHKALALVPLGTLALVAIPPMWDFATSGLETGLNFGWLGACFWLLARRLTTEGSGEKAAWRPIWPALVIGLGWLIRPDAALYTVFFGLALLIQSKRSILSWLGALVAAFAIPAAYQIFRMGYYAALVPNTALAKDAVRSQFIEGLYYLLDYVQLYAIWFPVLIALLVCLDHWRWAWQTRQWGRLALLVLPGVAAVLHLSYIVRVGGDFMHARFLLPGTMALLMPVGVVAITEKRRNALMVLAALTLGWAVAIASGTRTRYVAKIDIMNEFNGRPERLGVANEREWWTHFTLTKKTVHKSDWQGTVFADFGVQAQRDLERGYTYYLEPGWLEHVMSTGTPDERGRLAAAMNNPFTPPSDYLHTNTGRGVYIKHQNMGVVSLFAGNDVKVVDEHALTDAVTARAKPDPITRPEYRLGHSRKLADWRVARYAAPNAVTETHHVENARAALKCGDLARLQRAITQPMTKDRFINNVKMSPRLTFLTFPEYPADARQRLCGWTPPANLG